MEDLIRAKDEQIEKLNNLKELLKQQIISLQEENSKLKSELYEMEELFKQIPKEKSSKPDFQSSLNSINAKLTTIVEKLDDLSVQQLVSSPTSPKKSKSKTKPKAINEDTIKKAEPHPAEIGLIKPSSLFSDSEIQPTPEKTQPEQEVQPSPVDPSAYHAADPRSLQRTVMEIDYPDNGVILCPKCGKGEFQEMPEPMRGSFAKKYYCKKCRQEWRFRY
jgi:hypothetical protein